MESSVVPQSLARAIVPVFWLAAAIPSGGVGWILAAVGALLPLAAPRILPLMVLTSCFFYATMALSSTVLYALRAYWIAAFLAWLLLLEAGAGVYQEAARGYLPEAAVKESTHRVERAIVNSGFQLPRNRIVINMAPADLPKEAASFDLPIALGLLAGSGQMAAERLSRYAVVGELALPERVAAVADQLLHDLHQYPGGVFLEIGGGGEENLVTQ